jgi:hypothetical protein
MPEPRRQPTPSDVTEERIRRFDEALRTVFLWGTAAVAVVVLLAIAYPPA